MDKKKLINKLAKNLPPNKLQKILYEKLIKDIKSSLKNNKLKHWSKKSLTNFIDDYVESHKKNTDPWVAFTSIFKPNLEGKDNKQVIEILKSLKEPYREFKGLVVSPMKYVDEIVKRKTKQAGGKVFDYGTDSTLDSDSNSDSDCTTDSESDNDVSNKSHPDNDVKIKKGCKCGKYIITLDMKKPYAVDNSDQVYSIKPPEHGCGECSGQQVNGEFQICPNFAKERECILISGPSGSGKTWIAKEYLRKYHKLYPKRKITLFANKPFEDFKVPYDKPELSENMNLKVNNFKDSIIVFDDVENIHSNQKIQDEIINFLEEVLNVGRSMHVSIIVISHILMNYRFTRNMIMECNKIIIFPNSGIRFQYENFLAKYIGLGKNQIKDILDTRSRWLCIDKESPITTIDKNRMQIIS